MPNELGLYADELIADLQYACEEHKDCVWLSKKEVEGFATLFEAMAELLAELPMVPDKHKAVFGLMNASKTLRKRMEE